MFFKKLRIEKDIFTFLYNVRDCVRNANFKSINFAFDLESYIVINTAYFRSTHPNNHLIVGVNSFFYDAIDTINARMSQNGRNIDFIDNCGLIKFLLLKETKLNADLLNKSFKCD